jgi:putative NADH-flavin reductase
MKVIVFGATGTVGKQFVREALNGGCQVTAFARTLEKLEIEHQKLSIYRGDALDAAAVADAVRGHDAVVVTLGAGASWKSKIRSEGTRNVIDAMKRHGVQRLVCQSTIGAHESWGNLNLFW